MLINFHFHCFHSFIKVVDHSTEHGPYAPYANERGRKEWQSPEHWKKCCKCGKEEEERLYYM